jgi:hypothetical protein
MKIIFTAFFACILSISMNAHAESYEFKIKNTTDSKMVDLLVSEDGKSWGYFDLGAGVGAGNSATMVWDESTNSESCKQQVKAVYADGEESEAASFDFCEDGLELEF